MGAWTKGSTQGHGAHARLDIAGISDFRHGNGRQTDLDASSHLLISSLQGSAGGDLFWIGNSSGRNFVTDRRVNRIDHIVTIRVAQRAD